MAGDARDPVDSLTIVGGLPLGARVVVRHRLPDPDPASGATLTDVVGELLATGPRHVRVATRRGPVEVDVHLVTAAKVIPPRPSRRGAPHRALSPEDLQRVMVDAWPPMERAELGGWVLRAARGFTGRANSCLALGSPGLPLTDAVDRVEGWYAARGLPANVCLVGPVGFAPATDPLGAELVRRRYRPRVPTLTLTAPALPGTAADVRGVVAEREVSEEWMAAFAAYRRLDREAAEAILMGSPDQRFASVREEGGRVVGIARLGIAHGWGGIGAMWVDPDHRRAGVASALLQCLRSTAVRAGVRSLHLQTDATNAAALRLFRAHGFEDHHAYVNLVLGAA